MPGLVSYLYALAAGLVVSSAHVALTPSTVAYNQSGVVAVRVGHGCDGAATTSISVQIPTGVTGVTPVYIPGWNVTVTTRPAGASAPNNNFTDPISKVTYSASSSGASSSSGSSNPHEGMSMRRRAEAAATTEVDSITWSGGSIPEGTFFDFGLKMKTPAQETTLAFPVIQLCDDKSTDWFGDSSSSTPASFVKVVKASTSSTSAAGLARTPNTLVAGFATLSVGAYLALTQL
ncbi:hypothetical protein IWQ60_003799 [Tieghemiomyces parasiticus]|uniref:YncI copper-binding domain-containing protein n=1 Tax=Tieghemiomyces parasiticus TaxID=78921 RepID=A0A9W8ACL7_9FUNG|nr:hypothetical protein IWQ60_003799 [Tieghemiomyces parasiticus]